MQTARFDMRGRVGYINRMTDVIQEKDEVKKPARVWQLDALRGTAMVLMTVFHAMVDIRDFFRFADVRYFEPPLLYIGRASAILFIFVSGLSCRFSRNNMKRSVKVLVCGMLITAVTLVAVGDLYVRFGILHFLGASMLLMGLLEKIITDEKKRQLFVLIASPVSLLAGLFVARINTGLPFLFIFGIVTPDFLSYDFYPLFPWIGIYFIGYAAGKFVLNNREKLSAMRNTLFTKPLTALGRISLIYYILHQPALFVVFYGLGALFSVTLNL